MNHQKKKGKTGMTIAFKYLITSTLSLCFLLSVQAQEIRGLSINQKIRNATLNKSVRATETATDATTSFPFFDDFSGYHDEVFPDPALWSDDYAFINSSFPDSAISIGVATLDAIGNDGSVYAIDSDAEPSDTLTSNSMDISGITGDTIYLSFFYQAGGKGDEPEKTDTLLVDFFDGTNLVWVNVWKTYGDTLAPFKQVVIPVDDTLKSEQFRFRFRNYTSLSLNDIIGGLGALSNVDQWHIDYVQCKQAGSREEMYDINDLAIIEPLLPTLKLYNTMPWTHLVNSLGQGRSQVNPLMFRTLFPDRIETIKVTRTHMTLNVLTGDIIKVIGGQGGYENEEPPVNISKYSDFFTSDVSYNDAYDHGEFEIISYLVSDDVTQYRGNDTVRRSEIFRDYYAYDDGTSEYGFGITGESAYGAQVAYMFKIYRNSQDPDTLTGVDIYFNKVKNDYTSDMEFLLCVWENNKGIPGNLIYNSDEDEPYTPNYGKGINEFTRIPIEEDLIVSDTIFVGFTQLTDEFINVGYDINLNSTANIFVNTDAIWYSPENSIQPGSLMIRPVFGYFEPTAVKQIKYCENDFHLYPNPSPDYIQLTSDNLDDYNKLSLRIINILGETVFHTDDVFNQIDVSSFSTGIYFVVISQDDKSLSTIKFIKSH